MYKNIQHKYTIILTKYITQTLQNKIIVTNKFMLAVLHYCYIHVHNENTLIILILLCSNCVSEKLVRDWKKAMAMVI